MRNKPPGVKGQAARRFSYLPRDAPTRRLTPLRDARSSDRRSQKARQGQGQSTELLSTVAGQGRTYGSYCDVEYIDPSLSGMSPPGDPFWYSLLADLLYALGDSQIAFQIQAHLYKQHPEVSRAVTCARYAQVRNQVNDARIIIEEAINTSEADEYSSDKFLFGAQLARNWDQAGEKENAFEQFGDLLEKYIDLWTSQFHRSLVMEKLRPDTPIYRLDVLAYIYLRHSIRCFNKDELNFQEGEEKLDENTILKQFLDQQPVSDGNGLTCLRSCLTWCIGALGSSADPPEELKGIPGQPVYQIVCFLLRLWLQDMKQPQQPPWSIQAMEQLRISASELLIHVICMIMATPPRGMGTDDRHSTPFKIALGRANRLNNASSNDAYLLDCFLSQIQQTADQRMAAREDIAPPPVNSNVFRAVREVLRTSLPEGIDLPPAHNGYIHPLVVGEQVKHEAVIQAPSAVSLPWAGSSFPSFVDFQYGEEGFRVS